VLGRLAVFRVAARAPTVRRPASGIFCDLKTTPALDPVGKRRGSLRGSGTHDEDSTPVEGGGYSDRAEAQRDADHVADEEAGAGATELEERIRARDER
jgi:hypothetical protein